MFLSMLPLIVSLVVMVVLAFRQVNIIFVAVISTAVLALMAGIDVVEAISKLFMTGASNYVLTFFPLFLFSVLFGGMMEKSGSAAAVAKYIVKLFKGEYVVVGLAIASGLLVFGGVNALVIVFTVYPIALYVFREANLPRHLIPGVIAAGAYTFAACFPGANALLCMEIFGTTPMAGPLVGLICGLALVVVSCVYLLIITKKAVKQGEHFDADEKMMANIAAAEALGAGMNPFLAILPAIVIVVSLNVFHVAMMLCMLLGCLACFLLNFKALLHHLMPIMSDGASDAARSIMFTASAVGFGSVVTKTAGFSNLLVWCQDIGMGPYLSFALATTLICGFSGSGTGGFATSVTNLGATFLAMGGSGEAYHRIGSIACVGLDSLPHNGAVNMLLNVCGMNHKQSYKPIFFTTVVFTLGAMFLGVFLCNIMYPL